jgi:hypothetical protein
MPRIKYQEAIGPDAISSFKLLEEGDKAKVVQFNLIHSRFLDILLPTKTVFIRLGKYAEAESIL